ncbi:hypothetical protein ACIBCD_38540 [Nocardia brasiliensis]|uniref:hypothetical protein n=1 Tax=Nocardia brasiliensis TaxID=37326 RepID=UPI0037A02EF0
MSTAMLLIMETLIPAERVALVLHDVFDFPFSRVADVLATPPPPAASSPLAHPGSGPTSTHPGCSRLRIPEGAVSRTGWSTSTDRNPSMPVPRPMLAVTTAWVVTAASLVMIAPAASAADDWKYTCDTVTEGQKTGSYTGSGHCAPSDGAISKGEIRRAFVLVDRNDSNHYSCGTVDQSIEVSGIADVPQKVTAESCEALGPDIQQPPEYN